MNGVSIIIIAHNNARRLEYLLSSTININNQYPLQFIIIDHGSTDETAMILERYSSAAFIRLIKRSNNDTFASSANLGARKADYPYLLFPTLDTDYPENFFLQALRKKPDSGEGIAYKIFHTKKQNRQIKIVSRPIEDFFPRFNTKNNVHTTNKPFFVVDEACLFCRKKDFEKMKSIIYGSSSRTYITTLGINLDSRQRQISEKHLSKNKTTAFKPSQTQPIEFEKNNEYKKAKEKVKLLRTKLYNLGFIECAYKDLKNLTAVNNNPTMRRLAARELAVWHANQYTREDAEKCLDLLFIERSGEHDPHILRQNIVLEAECLEMMGQTKSAKKVIFNALKREQHADLCLAAANLEMEISNKMIWINKALALHDISPIVYNTASSKATFDCLQPAPGSPKKESLLNDTPKVTVIIPAYNAQDIIRTALDSILNQTWSNLEVLVVDDCSTDHTVEVVKDYELHDTRVRLIKAKSNQGPYVARNLALREATGDLVTVNDADDWSHPEKVEVQVKHLIENPKVIANTSELSRAYNNLLFFRRGQTGSFVQLNISSLMFRRKITIEAIGYWRNVRFGADGEFKKRLKKFFGEMSVVDLKSGMLSFLRQSKESLTANNAFGYPGYLMGARKEFIESHNHYYNKANNYYYSFSQKNLAAPVPEPMWPIRAKQTNNNRHFDVIIASDFRLPGGTSSSNIEEIKVQKDLGLQTGLVQIYRYLANPSKALNPKIREQLDGKQVQMLVYGESISCDLLIVRHPPILQEYQRYIPNIKARNIVVIVNQSPLSDYSNHDSRAYDLNTCVNNMTRYFGDPGIWYPIGPAVRQALLLEPNVNNLIKLSSDDWTNIINIDQWRVNKKRRAGTKPIIGRHSRDHYVKWPENKYDLLLAYPKSAKFKVHILGGASIPKKIIGNIPANWEVYPFNSIHPRDFLAGIDFFVYFTHSDMVEAFGRTPLEAMAAGIPTILPNKFKPLFKNAAIYAKPSEIQKIVMELYQDEDYYQTWAESGRRFVREHFGYGQHIKRLSKYLEKINNHVRNHEEKTFNIKIKKVDHQSMPEGKIGYVKKNTNEDIVYIFSNFTELPDHYFNGYCFVNNDYIYGQEGADIYFENYGNHIPAGEDGCYISIHRNYNGYNIGVDYSGNKKLFYFFDGHSWGISNSIMHLANHMRENNCKITIDNAQLSFLKCNKTIAKQLSCFSTIFNEIKLLPSYLDMQITDNYLTFKRTSCNFNTDLSYKDSLSLYLNTWLCRFETLLANNVKITCDLTGGRDSRINFAFIQRAQES